LNKPKDVTPEQLVDILSDKGLLEAIQRYDEIRAEIQDLHNELNTPPWQTYTDEEAESWRGGCWDEIDALISESLFLDLEYDLSKYGRPPIKY
jgi:hypothetical protein